MSGPKLGPAGVTALAVAVAGLASSCSVLLDFSEQSDAAQSISQDACRASEPNDSIGAAPDTAPGTYQVAVCPPGDTDFYSVEVADGQDLSVVIEFENQGGAGDLEMRLYNLAGDIVDRSELFSNEERIERTAAMGNQLAAGTYIVEVFGATDVQNAYSLTVTVETPPAS